MWLTHREFRILCAAAEAEKPLSPAKIAEAILADCPGPRTARAYAGECCGRLMRAGLLDGTPQTRGWRYSITHLGREQIKKLSSPHPLTPQTTEEHDAA